MSTDKATDNPFEVASESDRPVETPYDKDLAVFLNVPIENRNRLARADTLMVNVHRQINESEPVIDQLGFYTMRDGDHQIFVFHPTSPGLDEITGTQAELDEDTTRGDLPDRIAVVVDALNKHLPSWLTPRIGPFWLGAFGRSPPVVCRLVMPGDGKLTRAENINGNVLKDFIHEYSDEAYALQVITRHRPGDLPPNYEYSLTVRIALFAPQHQVHTQAELADALGGNRARNPTTVFEPLGVSSNWDAFDDVLEQSSILPDYVTTNSRSNIRSAHHVLEYATGVGEWPEFKRERYVGADEYDHVCNYTELMAREADLPQVFTLATPGESPSPWLGAYGRDPGRATELKDPTPAGRQEAMELRDADADPPAEIAAKQRSSANDGTEQHWRDIKRTARILREQGYDVLIIEQDSGSRPDLWVRDPDGQIYAVEVECTSPSKPANALSNISRTALWGYPVIVVASEEPVAETLQGLIATPFRETDDRHTRWYHGTRSVRVDGKPVLVPKDAAETEWWATPERTRELKLDGKTLIETPLDAPFDDQEYPLPRLHKDGDEYVVKNPDGSIEARYQTKERFQANWGKLPTAHIPVGLSYFPFVEAMHVIDDNRLVEHHPTADWDTPKNAERHEASHEAAFTNFLIHKQGSELDEPPVRAFIRNWIGTQTQYGTPAKNIYGEYRQDYTNRSRNDDRHTANRFYADAAYRYPRGLVHAEAKGLTTLPDFPDDWDIPDDQRLQDPLIHNLDTRTTTYDETDTEDGDDD